jgi:DNA-binding transcriptional LysR family regulator
MRLPLISCGPSWQSPIRAAVVAATHPIAIRAGSGEPLTVVELADHIQIVTENPSPLTEGRDYGVLSPRTCRVSDNSNKLALILAGVGWGNLPLWLIPRELAKEQLVRIPAAEFGREGETIVRAYLAHRSDKPLGPAGRLFRHALRRRVDGVLQGTKDAVDVRPPLIR